MTVPRGAIAAHEAGPPAPAPSPLESGTSLCIDLARVTRLRVTEDGGREIVMGSVRGWAVCAEPLARIDVLMRGRLVATARIGESRPDIAALFPDIAHAAQAGFEANLTGGQLMPQANEIMLRLATLSGQSLSVAHPLTVLAETSTVDAMPIRMAVDDCVVDSCRQLRLSGWALAMAPIAAIQVSVAGRHVATVTPNRARPDVTNRLTGYLNEDRCGFSLAQPLPPEVDGRPAAVRVEVFARDGAGQAVVLPVRFEAARTERLKMLSRAAPVPLPAPAPTPGDASGLGFHCDAIRLTTDGLVRITGWCFARQGVAAITIALDDISLGQARTGLSRPDVGRAFPDRPEANRAGFAFETRLPRALAGACRVDFRLTFGDGTLRSISEIATASEPEDPGADDRQADILLAVDGMRISDGHAARRVNGSFHLIGWAIGRAGIATVEAFLDDVSLGKAHHGLRREDVAAAHPQFADSLRGGFALSVPAKTLQPGLRQFRIVATAIDGAQAETGFSADIEPPAPCDAGLALRRRVSAAETTTHRAILAARGTIPLCDLVLRLPSGPGATKRVLATLESLVAQAHEPWRLWLAPAPGGDCAAILRELADRFPEHAGRLRPMTAYEPPAGPSLCGILLAGDVLAADGLIALILAAGGADAGDLVYGDDLRCDAGSRQPSAFCKPDWSPDLLLSQNYIGRAWLARGEVLRRAGLDLTALAAMSDYAALLRLSETAHAIRHVRQPVLRAGRAPASIRQERRDLSQALLRRGIDGAVEPGRASGLHRIRRRFAGGKVSIIVPTIAAGGHIRRCLASIRRLTRDIDYEIIILDNLRGQTLTAEQRGWRAWLRAQADIVLAIDEPFNWSRLNNRGAEAASGDFLLFLTDDIEVVAPDWLSTLAAEAQRPEIGVVGAQLVYPDGKVQHAGMALSRQALGHAGHFFRFSEADDPGPFGLALSQRNVTCVTGACMMVQREVFRAAGGFDEAHDVVNNDVDLCLRLHEAGRQNIYTPHVRLIHHELASRAGLEDSYDGRAFLARWGDACRAGDPFHNPNLDADIENHTLEEEPLREVYAGRPLGFREQVRRILVVKLDHIGDFVTALPALRRVKRHFPQARLEVLAAPASAAIARLEPAIDEVIPFAFFEARSERGERRLRQRDKTVLEAQLKARRYDLAIDLRKLPDTREMLKLAHAPLLAGFDSGRSFPWLDIALEWEADAVQAGKRSHVADDLLNLVDAVGNAFDEQRDTVATGGTPPRLSEAVAQAFPALLATDYVALHPAAGNALRQWPAESFARLIDLLAARDGLHIALIGGADERAIADAVLAPLRHRASVSDLTGRIALADLPGVLAASVLFIGNNSGPSHIAAGLGVPTVAIHSAVIASEEWGPLGPAAVALRRDMSCAPCYIRDVEQCHRRMACLTGISPHAVHALCRRFLSLRAGRRPRPEGAAA